MAAAVPSFYICSEVGDEAILNELWVRCEQAADKVRFQPFKRLFYFEFVKNITKFFAKCVFVGKSMILCLMWHLFWLDLIDK